MFDANAPAQRAEINRRLIFRERVVRIAVQPPLARLRGSDHRVSTGVRVFGGVPIR